MHEKNVNLIGMSTNLKLHYFHNLIHDMRRTRKLDQWTHILVSIMLYHYYIIYLLSKKNYYIIYQVIEYI